ncbi:MAG: polysaccharide deacetylase family protein [Candidatus Wallbacteria bacterium]|nr:polysaccharide deacetylase family protein [Candidatus Wallbacteria bacterium]
MRKSIGLALALVVLAALQAEASDPGVSVLCYHHFEDRPLQGFSVKPADFEAQMAQLASGGFHVIRLSEAVERFEGKNPAPFPEKAVVLTIDDGYRCAYERALPVMRKYKFPATLFVYPGYVGAKGDKCSWEEYKQLEAEGLFDVQCHSYTHPNFAQMARKLPAPKYETEMHREIFTSKKTLEEKLSKKIQFLAYPFGIYDEQIRDWALAAGYRSMFSVNGAANSPKTKAQSVSRTMVMAGDSLKAFTRKAAGLPLDLEIVSPRDGQILENGPYRVVANIADPDVKVETVRGVSAGCAGKIDVKSRRLELSSTRGLKPGVHIVTVTASDKSGRGTRMATWLFRSK